MNPRTPAQQVFHRCRTWLLLQLALYAALACQTIQRASAEEIPQFVSRVWKTDDGLPQISVKSIAQTRDGYLWFGTFEGLARFDGLRFKVWENVPPGITTRWFTALCGAKDGSLWIGMAGGGVVHLRGTQARHYSRRNGLSGDDVRSICEDNDGSIWIGTSGGLSRFKDGAFTNFTQRDGLNHKVVRAMALDARGRLWIVAGDAGVNRVENGRIIDPFSSRPVFANNSVRAICHGRDGSVWMGGDLGLVREQDGERTVYTRKNGLSDNVVVALCEDHRGDLWIGTLSGLNRLAGGELHVELKPDGTPWDPVNTIFEDRDGNIWVGTIDGLCRMTSRQFTVYTKQEGLSYNDVMSLYEDQRGSFWIATWGGGLNQLKNGKVRVTGSHDGLFDRILAVTEDHAGNIWVGCDQAGGLFRITLGDTTFNNPHGLTEVAQSWTGFTATNGFTNTAVRVIYEDRRTNLWISTGVSLALFKDGTFTHFTEKNGLPGNLIQAICEDHQGVLWIGGNKGLGRFQNGTFAVLSNAAVSTSINALFEDADHTMWIGTWGNGLVRMRGGENPAFRTYTARDGLFTDAIHEIVDDSSNNLWMSSRKGIFRVSKQNLDDFDARKASFITCVAYSQVDGGAGIIGHGIAKPSALKARDGRLWFATAKGIVGFDPEILLNSGKTPPPVMIEEVIFDKFEVAGTGAGQNDASGPGRNLVLKPGRGELEFHYTALNYRNPEKCRFKYKLEGYDSSWVEADTRRVAFYNSIRPGEYLFQVIACNSDGVWNESGASLKVTLLPHYWQTWWFKSFLIVASLSIAAAAARYVTKRRMQLKLERMEQERAVERERTRIAQDIHDDVGATLTQISVLSQLAEKESERPERVQTYTHKITESSRELAQAMDEIVWAVNPKNDSLRHLVGYIFRFTEEFLSLTELRLRKERPQVIPDIPFPAEMRHNVFLVVKEAINNIVKHSGASEVHLSLDVSESELTIHIEDDGRGFSELDLDSFGNGLANMRKRIGDVGGCVMLDSAPQKGTRIRLVVPLPTSR